MISHGDCSYFRKPPNAGVKLPAVFVLSSVLRARDISREDQTGDCDEHIEKLNIVHTHHSPLLYEIAERTTRSPLPAYTASFYHIAGNIARRVSMDRKGT